MLVLRGCRNGQSRFRYTPSMTECVTHRADPSLATAMIGMCRVFRADPHLARLAGMRAGRDSADLREDETRPRMFEVVNLIRYQAELNGKASPGIHTAEPEDQKENSRSASPAGGFPHGHWGQWVIELQCHRGIQDYERHDRMTMLRTLNIPYCLR
jgi:hypothetical protein